MAQLSFNVSNFITLKLKHNNYPLWREQAMALAESQELVDHLTGESKVPEMYTTPTDENPTKVLTKDYITWRNSDRLLRGWIIGTLTEEALGLVIGLDTAHKVWDALQKSHAQISQEREFTLRQEITYLRKNEDTTIEKHISELKRICDNLAALGSPIPEKEKIFALLTSFGPKYESFTTSMLKPPTPSYSELVSLLQGYEQKQSLFNFNSTPHVAFFGRKQNSLEYPSRKNQNQFNSSGRGFQAHNFHNSNTSMHSRPIHEANHQQNSHQNNSNANVAACRPPPHGQRRMTPTER